MIYTLFCYFRNLQGQNHDETLNKLNQVNFLAHTECTFLFLIVVAQLKYSRKDQM